MTDEELYEINETLRKQASRLAGLAGEAVVRATPEGPKRREALDRLYDLCRWIDKQFGWGWNGQNPSSPGEAILTLKDPNETLLGR